MSRKLNAPDHDLSVQEMDMVWACMRERLRDARQRLAWSPEYLAGKLKVSVSSVPKLESGEKIPRIVVAMTWANLLGIEFEDLYRAACCRVTCREN